MNAFRRQLPVICAIVLGLAMGAVVSAAIANHVHTVGRWDHGLGEGANSNGYVHPYMDEIHNTAHSGCVGLSIFTSNSELAQAHTCATASHIHQSWDVSPEHCTAARTDGYEMTRHYHYHDSFSRCSSVSYGRR